MKLVNMDLGIDIDVEENYIYELIIEHSDSFSRVVGSLIRQVDGDEGAFIVSDNNKAIKLDKQADIIVDYFSISPNNKKIISKLYSKLEAVAEEYVIEKAEINSRLISLLDKLTVSLGYGDIGYDLDFKWTDIFKLYNVNFMDEYDSLLERLISYIKVLSELTDVKILFLVNVKSYLDEEEIGKLYQMVNYYKVSLILIESTERSRVNHEKRYIIDKDRCFIDVN